MPETLSQVPQAVPSSFSAVAANIILLGAQFHRGVPVPLGLCLIHKGGWVDGLCHLTFM